MFAAFLRSPRAQICIATLLLCLPGIAGNAQATLDFEELSNPNNPGGYNGQSNVFDGFVISTLFGNLHSVSPDAGPPGNVYNYTGSVALFNGGDGSTTTIARDNGNPFTLNSIDIANVQFDSPGVTVLFTGHLNGGGTVTNTFTHGANNGLETVAFDSSWTNLTSVDMSQDAPFNQFDNIVLDGGAAASATPEPGSLALLSVLGISGVFVLRRRRKV